MLGSQQARSHPALTDAQTGLANRLQFDVVFTYLCDAGVRGLPFTIMLVSAGLGDGASRDLIRTIGKLIQSTMRSSDLVSHDGEGRYRVLLIATNLQGGRLAADRIELALEGIAPTPVCFGLSALQEGLESADRLMEAAETALTVAEAAGGGVELA